VITVLLGYCGVLAQSSDTLRGTVDMCYGVRFADNVQPFDTIVVDRPLPDSSTRAYLLCMQTSETIDSTGLPTTGLPQVVGRLLLVSLLTGPDTLRIDGLDFAMNIDTASVYQLVVPVRADTIVVDSFLTSRPWDGASGGVLVLEAKHALVIHDTVSVAGLGYRGGLRSVNGGDCNASVACELPTSPYAASKGESSILPITACAAGYLPWFTGGGGGNSHNSGGGGGGNGGQGGRGGDQWQCGGIPGMYGLPGYALPPTAIRRVLMGGGGGGGHQNNGVGTDGAAGGGAIVLRAPVLLGDTAYITAAGGNVVRAAGNDAGGGGGAGGTVILDVCRIAASLTVDIRGGNGGNADDSHGPGGGGGGGRLLVHPVLWQYGMPNLQFVSDGGLAGRVRSGTTSRNAADGSKGIVHALCDAAQLHTIRVDTAAGVGEQLMLRIEPGDTSDSFCHVTNSIDVSLSGGAVVVDSVDVPYGIRFEQAVDAWNQRRLHIELPSNASWSIPLRATMSRDSITRVETSCTPSGIPAPCDPNYTETTITVDACGLALRPIVRGVPYRLWLKNQDISFIEYAVSAFANTDVHVRLCNLQGQVVLEQHHNEMEMISQGNYELQGRLLMQGVPSGIYFITAVSGIGIDGISLVWQP